MHTSGPARLALFNLAVRNVTSSAAERDAAAITVDLSSVLGGKHSRDVNAVDTKGATFKRMTAPGLDSTNSGTATWAGQSFENGVASGKQVIERVSGNTVTLQGSEAVLVFL